MRCLRKVDTSDTYCQQLRDIAELRNIPQVGIDGNFAFPAVQLNISPPMPAGSGMFLPPYEALVMDSRFSQMPILSAISKRVVGVDPKSCPAGKMICIITESPSRSSSTIFGIYRVSIAQSLVGFY